MLSGSTHLQGMLSVVYCRRVVIESRPAVAMRRLQWTQLCEGFGMNEKTLAVTLNASSKVRASACDHRLYNHDNKTHSYAGQLDSFRRQRAPLVHIDCGFFGACN
jgi:hypothetical protein